MRGSIVKRGKSYSIVVDVGQDEDGKRKQRWYSGYRTRKAAESELTTILSSLQTGAYVGPTKETLGPYMEAWLAAPRKPNTQRTYESLARNHIIPNLGTVPLQKLTTARINALYTDLLGKLGARSIGYVHVVLHSCLEEAVSESKMPRNPAHGARRPSVKAEEQKDMTVWNASQLRAFLTHPDVIEDRQHGAYVLLANTGMRRGECLALRWGDLDQEHGRLSIRRNLVTKRHPDGRNELVFVSPKGNRPRTVKLDRGTPNQLSQHRLRQLKERTVLDMPAPNDADMIFGLLEGEPLRPGNFSTHFEALVKKAGLPLIGPHGLRHTYATLALAAGVSPKIVQERLGHASISITLDLYSHVLPETESDAAERIAALIAGEPSAAR